MWATAAISFVGPKALNENARILDRAGSFRTVISGRQQMRSTFCATDWNGETRYEKLRKIDAQNSCRRQ